MAVKTFVFRPTFRGVFLTVLSFPVFALFSWNVGKDVRHFPLLSLNGVGSIVLAALFGFGSLLALYYLLTTKVVLVNANGILIRYPIIFKHAFFAFQDIQVTQEEPFKIKATHSSFPRNHYFYQGKNIIIQMISGKQFEINSFQTQNFDKLHQIIRSHVGNVRKEKEQIRRRRK